MISGRSRLLFSLLAVFVIRSCVAPAVFAQAGDPVAKALEEGKLYESKHKWDLAFEAYKKADKLSHHSSPEAFIGMALIEKKAGLLSEAANDAKKGVAAAGENKSPSIRGRLLRASLLVAMANKPSDNKLKDAEAELRMALALDPQLPVTHLNLGMVLIREEKDADGVAELKTFVALPGASADAVTDAKLAIANPIRVRTPFVPNFSLTTHDNQPLSNASLRGKVVLIDFWGTWCPPCRESVPILKNVQKKYGGKPFQLLSISSDDDEDIWKTFIAAQHMDWAEYLDSSGKLQERFKVDSFPTYVVVDKDGVIRFRQSGLSQDTQSDLEDAINKSLKKASDPEMARIAAEGDTAEHDAGKSGGSANLTPGPNSSGATALAAGGSTSSGRVYQNTQLRLRYVYPEGWTAATSETLRAANDRVLEAFRAALQKQQVEVPSRSQLIGPTYIFYASGRGDGAPERASLPSISLRIDPTRLDTVSEEQFRLMMDRVASMMQLKVLAPASAFEVKKHKFVRADFERTGGALHYCRSYVQTVAGDYLLNIEIVAETPEQLNKIADTLQSMEIEDSE